MSQEKIYQVLLSESEAELAKQAIKQFMERIPNRHDEAHLYLKAFETYSEIEAGNEVDIDNKIQWK